MVVWLILNWIASAAPPQALAWSELDAAAEGAWVRGLGAAYDAERAGLTGARSAEPPAQLSVTVQVSPTLVSGLPTWDDNNMAAIGISVGNRRDRRLAWWQAQADAVGAAAAAERLAFGDQVREAWLESWIAAAFVTHLEEHADELDTRLEALRPAVESGVLPRVLIDELSVELGRLRAEAALHEQAADTAAVRLAGLLGAEVRVDVESLPSLEEAEVELDTGNPWHRVLDRVSRLPSVRRLEVEAAATSAEARLARSRTVSVDLGAIHRPLPEGGGSVGPIVGVTVPLTQASAPEARAADGRAAATRLRRDLRLRQLTAEIAAEARALDAAISRHERLLRTVEVPLQDRMQRLTSAMLAGSASVESVIRARRDLHEAFHDRARTTVDILVRRARGEALLAHVSEEVP